MTDLERSIRSFILRALLSARGPMGESALKAAIRSSFPNVAFSDGDLMSHVKDAEEALLIAGTNDDVAGMLWDLTGKGKIKAQQLRLMKKIKSRLDQYADTLLAMDAEGEKLAQMQSWLKE